MKNCPFCNASELTLRVEEVREMGDWMCAVICTTCLARGPAFHKDTQSRAAWDSAPRRGEEELKPEPTSGRAILCADESGEPVYKPEEVLEITAKIVKDATESRDSRIGQLEGAIKGAILHLESIQYELYSSDWDDNIQTITNLKALIEGEKE